MPLHKGYSPKVISGNIKELISAGHKPVQSVAIALSKARKYKKMWKGGMYSDGGQVLAEGGMEDMPEEEYGAKANPEHEKYYHKKGQPEGEYEDKTDSGLEFEVKSGGLAKNESMEEMGEHGPDDQKRDLNEIRADGEYYPDEVSNPERQKEDSAFAKALRRKAMANGMNRDYYGSAKEENYAMGGLVQGPEDEHKMGNKPGEGDMGKGDHLMDSTMREDDIPHEKKPDGLEHRIMGDPSGPGLSKEAKEAIERKKKSRRYGSYGPFA